VTGDVVDAGRIRGRLNEVKQRVEAAAAAAGRTDDVEVVLVTKYVSLEQMSVLADAGVRLVAENRAQDLVAKHDRYGDTFTWDFIGHLQSRKVKVVLPLVRLIHSVGSLSVVQELQSRAENSVTVLLEVNVAAEETKSGVLPAQVDAFLQEASACDQGALRWSHVHAAAHERSGRRGRSTSPEHASSPNGCQPLGAADILSRSCRWGRAPTTKSRSGKGPRKFVSAGPSSFDRTLEGPWA